MDGQGTDGNEMPGQALPKFELDDDIDWSRREIGGRSVFVAHHTATGRFFHFGAEEAKVFQTLNGRTIPEVVTTLAADGLEWSAEDLGQFVTQLTQNRLVSTKQVASDPSSADSECPNAAQNPQPPPPASAMNRTASLLSKVVSQRFPILDGGRLSQTLARWLGWTQTGAGVAAWFVAMGITLIALYRNGSEFTGELLRLFDSNLYVALFVFWLIAKIVHEGGHATAAAYHGVRVRKIGIMFFLAAPLAYVDVTDAWKLPRRMPRIQIALGGIYFELMIAAMAFWIWMSFPATIIGHLAAQMALVAGPATILINANPLLRLDGYFVVSDLTDISNLRMHGRNQFGALVNRALVGHPMPLSLLSGWRRPFATLHAAASVVFQVVWMSGLVFAVAMWMRGLGVLLALIAATLWCLLPLLRWTLKVWNTPDSKGSFANSRRRLCGLYASLALFSPMLLDTQSPLARRVPVAVQFQNEQIVRPLGDAVVQTVHVVPGQRVYTGSLLIEMDDPDLQLRRDDLNSQAMTATKQAEAARRRAEHSMAQSFSQRSNRLHRQIDEIDQQIASLTVHAHREGLIIGTDLERLENRFVHSGEVLFRIGDPSEKEILVAVPPSDMEAYTRAVQTNLPMPVRLRGGVHIEVVPASLAPRARREIPHPALAAGVGGPLAVESISESESAQRQGGMQLIQPHLQSRTPLDPMASQQVRVGQIGMLTIADNRTIYDRLKDYLMR